MMTETGELNNKTPRSSEKGNQASFSGIIRTPEDGFGLKVVKSVTGYKAVASPVTDESGKR
jgi:hypothetical protein